VLSVEGEDVRPEPYRQRRQTLEELGLDGLQWKVPATFEDGEALWAGGLRARARGRRCEAAARAVSLWRSVVGEDQEPQLLALRA